MPVNTLRPGSRLGIYPQRIEPTPGEFERLGRATLARISQGLSRQRYQLDYVVTRVNRAGAGLDQLDDDAIAECIEPVRDTLLRSGLQDAGIFRGFALVREYAQRTLGMRHFDAQLLGAWVIVNGNMAEMATGEGKSLTATLAAATAALAGISVHVITTNEYLASRDAQEMQPLYAALGLSVTAVTEDMDTEAKRLAYRHDIVYCTNKQIAFDYLRDRLVSRNVNGRLSMKFSKANLENQLLLPGLCFAIVDEADSVLIDEARTPLILSREHADSAQEQIYSEALALAQRMQAPDHYQLLEREQQLRLTDQGRDWLAEQLEGREGIWAGSRHSQHLVHQALCALHLFERDAHYLVRDDKVMIIDRHTGRTMEDRSWQRGLHQMIECKENCSMTGQRETLSSISYQRFFRRYLRLGGMSGTLQQVSRELRSVYQQRVISVPTHRPCQRQDQGFTLHRRASEKWLAVLAEIERIHARGQPVLVGTASVRDSMLLDSFLTRRRLSHRILNARQDEHEAQIIALAGQRGQITIATNMAGRGTDIKLGPGIADLGGLHVIVTECHEEYRVDRQLYGRCARQGDPGSVCTHLSLNDALLQAFYTPRMRRLIGVFMRRDHTLAERPSRLLVQLAQRFSSARYRSERKEVMRADEMLGKMLAYTGQRE